MVPERSVMPLQYVALALWRMPRIFLEIYIYIYPRMRESRFQWYSLVCGSLRSSNNTSTNICDLVTITINSIYKYHI